eukprot:1964017-Prymnesium_polylepis.1
MLAASGAHAAGCVHIGLVVTATFGVHVFVASSNAVPFVYFDRLEMEFVGYPSNSAATPAP